MPATIRCLIVLFSSVFLFSESALSADANNSVAESNAVVLDDVIPVTMGNLRGHKMLYDEGWKVITSSKEALRYAKETSIISSNEAIMEVSRRYSKHTNSYTEAVKEDVQDSTQTGKRIFKKGSEVSSEIFRGTHSLAIAEAEYAKEGFARAWDSFIQGNISLSKRTEEDRKELVNIPGSYFRNLKNDFSNIWEITGKMHERFSGKIEVGWDKAFQKASQEFKGEYEKSGEESNSITALGHVLYGYLKAFYHGLAAPSSKTIVKAGSASTAGAIFLPIATTSVVAGRTVQSVGLTVYYVGKTGVKIVSPTVEGGLLSGMSLLSAGAVPVTYVTGGTVGAINQVAFTAAGPAVAAGEAAVTTTVNTAGYVGFLAYDGVQGTTRVVINQAKTGIVIGYNAATAIPAHAVMGAVDTAIFLAWDGPRLVIASAQGRLKSTDGKEEFSAGDLPVGTAVDLKKLEKSDGIEIKVISEDPAVIRDVLQKLPCDLREQNEKCEQ